MLLMYSSHSSDFETTASELSTENLAVRFVSLTSTKSRFDLLCHYVGSGRCWPSGGHSACLVLCVHALSGGGAGACASVVEGPGQEVSSLCRQVSTSVIILSLRPRTAVPSALVLFVFPYKQSHVDIPKCTYSNNKKYKKIKNTGLFQPAAIGNYYMK